MLTMQGIKRSNGYDRNGRIPLKQGGTKKMKTKIGERWYTLHDTGLSKKEADERIEFLKANTKYSYFSKLKRADGYYLYKGT